MKGEASFNTPDRIQSQAARVAGIALLLAIAIIVAANYGVSFRLIIPNNAVETARNIAAHETLFRINIACDLLYVVDLLVMAAALYVVLKPAGWILALAGVLFRVVFALAWVAAALAMLGSLRFLDEAAYLPVFATGQLQTLARLRLYQAHDAYYTGLPFWGLASTVCSILWLKSRYIPRTLAVYGVASSAWCVFCAFAFIAFPHFDKTVNAWLFDMPLVLFEVALGLWLLIKGLRTAAPGT
ncbi:MAG: DUF4386 domain-containing protein [Acidobacteriota bacterium]